MSTPTHESRIVAKILAYLRERGCFCWKQHGNAYMPPGISDIIGLTPKGLFFAIEVKTQTGKPTITQEIFLDNIYQHNGIAFIARSVDDVKIVMEEYL